MTSTAYAGQLALALVLAAALQAQQLDYRLVHEEPLGGADSAISPDGAWIAFSSRRSGNLDLWMVEVATGRLKQLTDSESRDYEPRWHPAGTGLVFTSDRERNQDIYTIDLATLEVTQQTSTAGVADYPSYSHDASEIVFTGGPFGRNPMREVFVKNLASGKIRQVTEGHRLVGSTSFSPDGASIVYHAYYRSYGSERSDVFVVDAAGGKGTDITQAPDIWDYKPVWSYGGEWITFSSKRGTPNFNVFVVHSDGTGLRAITDQQGPDFRWPNFTRDGRIAWHAIVPQRGSVRRVDVASGEAADVVTSSSTIDELMPSPDGGRLLYADGFLIRVLDATDPEARPKTIARGRQPRWSADGAMVTCLGARDGELYEVPSRGGTAERAGAPREATAAGAASQSATARDGRARVAVVDGDLVLTAGDDAARKLTDDGEAKSSPCFSPDGRTIFFCQSQAGMVRYYVTEKPVTDS